VSDMDCKAARVAVSEAGAERINSPINTPPIGNGLSESSHSFFSSGRSVAVPKEKELAKGHELSGQYRWLDVFAKRGGTWQFIVSQGTKLEPAKKP
jgi:hypothetical protein